MITREDITWTAIEPVCFVCREYIWNDTKHITFTETYLNKAVLFKEIVGVDGRAYKSIKVCMSCWKTTAGEDWLFAE